MSKNTKTTYFVDLLQFIDTCAQQVIIQKKEVKDKKLDIRKGIHNNSDIIV